MITMFAMSTRTERINAMRAREKPPVQPEAPSPGEEESYLKMSQTAKILNCSQTSCYRLARTGAIPAFYFKGMVRIPRSALLAWLKANTK
jgi:excisionase family DNA binding protein